MNKIKLDYLQPGCKILVVRFEGMLMTSETVNNRSSETVEDQQTWSGKGGWV